MKHGLTSQGITELDDPKTYEEYVRELMEEWQPEGAIEKMLVRRIALCMIRLTRVNACEAASITATLNPPIYGQSVAEADLDRLLSDTKRELLDPGLPAQISDKVVASLCGSFVRYETAVENKLYRTINTLQKLQLSRRARAVRYQPELKPNQSESLPSVEASDVG
jgi:hypothetical protein